MKKLLLSTGLFIGLVFTGNAQVLQSEDFNGLTVGNVGTNITNTTPVGQGNFYTFATNTGTSSNAANENFQVVTTGWNGTKGLTVVSANGSGGTRSIQKGGGIVSTWPTRTSGNDILQVEVDFFTGSSSTSTTQNGIRIEGNDAGGTTRTSLASFFYEPSTKRIFGVAWKLNSSGIPASILINLGTVAATTLTDNTWYKVGIAYNPITGDITWKVNTADGNNFIYGSILPADRVAGSLPRFVIIYSATPSSNAAPASITYDNFRVTATPTENLLGTAEFLASKFSVYPNPSNNVINIANDGNMLLNAVTITDLNGRTVKSVPLNNVATVQVNIADLSAGMYMMNIVSDQGTVTKKIIKN
ncbi:MAG TPA: T9SS type A sorting domain-containing protein [Flavobacterium sp.]|jgi:hypothetical protein